jgi:hypothetical protein
MNHNVEKRQTFFVTYACVYMHAYFPWPCACNFAFFYLHFGAFASVARVSFASFLSGERAHAFEEVVIWGVRIRFETLDEILIYIICFLVKI